MSEKYDKPNTGWRIGALVPGKEKRFFLLSKRIRLVLGQTRTSFNGYPHLKRSGLEAEHTPLSRTNMLL
jgi:hypothetical protein